MHSKPALAAFIPALAVLLMLSGCEEKAAPAAQPTPRVGTVTLQAQPFTLSAELPGRTAAYRVAEVRPQVSGIIQKRLFTEGSEVKAGQQLYQIDPSVYQATAQSTAATLASSQALADRYALLVADQAVSKQAYDEARAAALQAKAANDRAQIDLRYTKVLAPIAGRIGRSAVTEGALVSNGQAAALATIQQIDPIYVDVIQSSKELLRLRKELDSGLLQAAGEDAAKVTLTLEDGSLYSHTGTLEFNEVAVDESTGTVTLRAIFPNPDRLLLPGMFVHAKLQGGVKNDAILAPQQGITRNPRGLPTAMVVTPEGKVELRELKAERTVGDTWFVEQGLNPGDVLITEGLQWIQPGIAVETYPAKNVSTAQPANGQD